MALNLTPLNQKMDHAFAEHFAADWVAAWNAYDRETILSHYAV